MSKSGETSVKKKHSFTHHLFFCEDEARRRAPLLRLSAFRCSRFFFLRQLLCLLTSVNGHEGCSTSVLLLASQFPSVCVLVWRCVYVCACALFGMSRCRNSTPNQTNIEKRSNPKKKRNKKKTVRLYTRCGPSSPLFSSRSLFGAFAYMNLPPFSVCVYAEATGLMEDTF